MKSKAPIFTPIVRWYDFLNSFFSLGRDSFWRKSCGKKVLGKKTKKILDIATGTGEMLKTMSEMGHHGLIAGVDPSIEMIKSGIERKNFPKTDICRCYFVGGVVENLPFKDSYFDAVTCAFGLRNFTNLKEGLLEIHRVLKEGGIFCAVEITIPENRFLKFIFLPYLSIFIPFVGNVLTGTKSYTYLKNSIVNFPSREKFLKVLRETGFVDAHFENMSGGIAVLYTAFKPLKAEELNSVAIA